MRRIFTLFIFSLLFLSVGCEEVFTDILNGSNSGLPIVDKKELVIPPYGGSIPMVVRCAEDWKITGTCDWCTPSIREGKASEKTTTIFFSADETYNYRKAKFWFESGKVRTQITITQNAKQGILADGNKRFEIPIYGGTAVISYAANIKCKVIIPEEAKSWITIAEPTRALVDYSVSLNIAKNTTNAPRKANVTVTATDNEELSATYIIDQYGMDMSAPIYSDDFDGKEATMIDTEQGYRWPLIDEFPEFKNSIGDSGRYVDYISRGVSVCANSASNSEDSHYERSGGNSLFLCGDDIDNAYLVIKGVDISQIKHLHYKITFGIKSDSPISADEFKLYLSNNGNGWIEAEYELSGSEPGEWNSATANFVFDSVPTYLYIKLEARTPSKYYVDDLAMHPSYGGQTISFESIEYAEPFVEVSTSEIKFTCMEDSQSVEIISNSIWDIYVYDSAEWITVTPNMGINSGIATITVAENHSGRMRKTEIMVYTQHNSAGSQEYKVITVLQSATERLPVEEEVLYSDNFDAQIAEKQNYNGSDYARFPYIDEIEFSNAEGPASAGVTYGGNKMTVRSNRQSNYNYYPASGNNNIFFGNGGIFLVNNIAPLKAGHMSYKISFVAEKYLQDSPDSQFSADEFKLYISKDGLAWAEIEYTRADGTEPGVYSLNTADFTLTTVPEALYIKFTTSFANVYRIDDLKLMVGNGGQTVDLDNIEIPAPAEKVTIAEVLALGQGATINGAIEGIVISNMELSNLTSKRGMYVQDETGALQLRLSANHTYAFGTKLQIDLTGTTLGQYGGAVQVEVNAANITEVSTGNTVEPKTVAMADFLANKYEGQYVALEGVQVVAADLSKTWVTGGAHTNINMEDAQGNKFIVFSSKYATYAAETVAQGAGTIKGIASINNGNIQIIFAQTSDYAGLTGERFEGEVASLIRIDDLVFMVGNDGPIVDLDNVAE